MSLLPNRLPTYPAGLSRIDIFGEHTCVCEKYLRRTARAFSSYVKKYGKDGLSEPITNLYLSAAEYEALAILPASSVVKKRYSMEGGSLDLFVSPCPGFAVFEREFASVEEAEAYAPPDFAGLEITGDVHYSSAALAEDL